MSRRSEPISRRRSTASSVVSVPTPLRHPTPDLQSLQGAYVKNIENLERSAERMSQDGSDIGEEIRRLSRQSSLQSSQNGDISVVRPGTGLRKGSSRSTRSGSYGRNIVDVNGAARWGGYSPAGYVTSPVGSVSWSQASLSRVSSGSKSSRLAQVSEPIQEGRPLDSPVRPRFSLRQDDGLQEEHSRDASQSSFAKRYDEIVGQIEESLEHVPPSPPKDNADLYSNEALHYLEVGRTDSGAVTPPDRPRSTDTYREAQIAFKDFDGVHFSPDTDEIVEFDQNGNEVRRVSARTASGDLSFEAASLLRTPCAQQAPQAPPPPDESMVYYPAPVPKMLNLPKRLSKLPAANVQAKRRTQVLDQLPAEARAGAPWLSQENVNIDSEHFRQASGHLSNHSRGTASSGSIPKSYFNERMSGNLGNVAPQLRAEMFFEHQPVQHDVEVKSESAVATLDSILAASATAPVHAFTDHSYAGDVRKSVYSIDKPARRSKASLGSIATALTNSPESKKPKKRRSSSIGGLLKRTSSSDEVSSMLKKRDSRASILTDFTESAKKLGKRRSQLSLGDELERETEHVSTPADEIDDPQSRYRLVAAAQNADHRVSQAPTVMSSGYRLDEAEQIDDDFREEDDREDVEDEDPMFVQPSTLLAELQVRKAQQKKRNKTAATAFPNGMHSTLLQLDAVEEINKRKRQNQRIALAWEDPHQRALDEDVDKNDEDVPLGMLFATKDGMNARKMGDGKDWDRPLGLMEKRQMEDNEPLSSRRNRLWGVKAPSSDNRLVSKVSQTNLPEQPEVVQAAGEEEDVEETLAQRMRRMRTKEALDGTVAHIATNEGERPVSTFSEEVLGQFGEGDNKDKKDANSRSQLNLTPSPQPEEEETLGQRRARLQRECGAGGEQRNISDGSGAARLPMLRSSTSLANLLASNPVGQRAAAKNYQPGQGSLLHTNAQVEAKQRSALLSTNMRSSSQGLERPLVDSRSHTFGQQPHSGGLLNPEHNSRAPAGGFAAGTYNNGMGGIQLQSSVSTPMYNSNNMPGMDGTPNGYFASPTNAAMGYGGYANSMMGMGYPQQQQQQQMTQMMYHQPTMDVHQQQAMMNQLAYGSLSGGQGMNMMSAGGSGNPWMPQTMGMGTYASYAQSMGGMNAAMMGGEDLNPNQRAAIDRWRMGIAPGERY